MTLPHHNRPTPIALAASGVVCALWLLALVEWLWMPEFQWFYLDAQDEFYDSTFYTLITWYTPLVLPLGVLAAAGWCVWAWGKGLLLRNSVLTAAYVPLWAYLVYAAEKIEWYAARAELAFWLMIGYYVIGCCWVIWGLEKIANSFWNNRKSVPTVVPVAEFEEGNRWKKPLWIAGTVLAGAGAALGFPYRWLADPFGDELTVAIQLYAGVCVVVFCFAALALWLVRRGHDAALFLLSGLFVVLLGFSIWLLLSAASNIIGGYFDASEAVRVVFYGFYSFIASTVLMVVGLTALASSAAIPRDDEALPRVWNPLDEYAWYYGQKQKKLKHSLAGFTAYSFAFLLLFLIFNLIPGCGDIYEMPYGGGEVETMAQQTVQIKKVKKIKYVLNPFSSIIFNPPPLEKYDLQLEEATAHMYKVGQGVGEGAGFSGGTGRGKVRFIRLEYAGGDWDQGFGEASDLNMLLEYGARTGHPVADRTESRTIGQLARFPLGKSPPMVYMTGEKSISPSKNEIRILREYITDKHGMLFGDNGGSGHFHNQFFAMMREVLPTVDPVPIPLDDPIHTKIYKLPFLPFVAPHGGRVAQGWKIDGRWVCYYHPGDIGDAWADEHAGVRPEVWENCYRLGVNVILYAHAEYNKWLMARQKR